MSTTAVICTGRGVLSLTKTSLSGCRTTPRTCLKLWTRSLTTKLKWSYHQGVSDVPMLGTTIGQQIQIQAEKNPDKEAAVFCSQNIRKTFKELMEEVDKLASGFLALGMKRGERLGIWGPNSYEWLLTMFASARIGCSLLPVTVVDSWLHRVNVNPAYTSNELEYSLKKVGVKAIVTSEKTKHQDYHAVINSVSGSCPDLMHIITMGNEKLQGALSFDDILDSSINKEIQDMQHEIQFDDPFSIQFTSGTTGKQKGVILSHHNILNNSYFIGRTLGYHESDARICIPVPLYHCFGCVVGALQIAAHGSCAVFPSPSFNPLMVLQAVQNERCTSLYGVPTMFIDVMAQPDLSQYNLSSLYTGVMSGSPCPMEVMRQAISKLNMREVTVCYGLTETSPVTFQSSRDDPLELRVSTVGRPQPMVEAKLIDENGKIVPIGASGELCTRGYSTMLGYWGDPEKTTEAITPDRWFHSGIQLAPLVPVENELVGTHPGDLPDVTTTMADEETGRSRKLPCNIPDSPRDIAIMNAEGYCSIVGRLKDMIIRGGENIYPSEIEDVLHQHPKVKDVQVFGVPDDRLGEEVCAYIKKSESNCTEEELRDFCRNKLARFKVPKYVKFVESYPLTVSGKVQKHILKDEAMKELGLQKIK